MGTARNGNYSPLAFAALMTIIVAVSGGVDSVVLLHMLCHAALPEYREATFVVAHVDHGIRVDSVNDARFVQQLAQDYGFAYETTKLELGEHASEEMARTTRYTWLEMVRRKYGAETIMTAHHEDDVIETIILNLLRGTSWRGLCSLRSTPQRLRPLLGIAKTEIVSYALDHGLKWCEDSTNASLCYERNKIRHLLMSRLSSRQRCQFVTLYRQQLGVRREIEIESRKIVERISDENGMKRYELIMMGPLAMREVMVVWLGRTVVRGDHERLRRFVCTARPGRVCQLTGSQNCLAGRSHLSIVSPSSI